MFSEEAFLGSLSISLLVFFACVDLACDCVDVDALLFLFRFSFELLSYETLLRSSYGFVLVRSV